MYRIWETKKYCKPFYLWTTGIKQYNIITVTLLNIRSLHKHSIDIKFDSNLTTSDIIFLTETQLLPQSNDNEIVNNLQGFTLHRQGHTSDRYSSLTLCFVIQ